MALDAIEQERARAALRELMPSTPYMRRLGLAVERWEADGVTLRIPFSPDLTNDGAAYHGGVVASLVDSAGAASVWAGHDFDKGRRAATVSMTVNYTGAALESDLVAQARCVRRGRELNFAQIEVTDADARLVATGSLLYRIVP